MGGHKELINRLMLHGQSTSLHPSGVSQMITLKLLQHWGPDGFKDHVDRVQAFYRSQCDVFIAAAEKHLTGLAEWSVPNAGMFVWIKLLGIKDSFDLITKKA